MLGFLKYKLPLLSVCDEYLGQLEGLMLSVDRLVKKEKYPILKQYENELAAFIFVLGRFIIQSSDLSEAEKQRFLVELIDRFSGSIDHSKILTNIPHSRKDLIVVEFLNNRISFYHDVMQADCFDSAKFKLIHCFFKLSGLLPHRHSASVDSCCSGLIMKNVDSSLTFLNTLKRDYRLTAVVV